MSDFDLFPMCDAAVAEIPTPAREVPVGLPLVVSYGGGVDSTAMLVGLWQPGTFPRGRQQQGRIDQ